MDEQTWLGHQEATPTEKEPCPLKVAVFTSIVIALVAFGFSLAALSMSLVVLLGAK